MNEEIIYRWNERVHPNDIVYLLGDVMLGNNEKGLELCKRLNGHIDFYMGNHDTINRTKLLMDLPHWRYCGIAGIEKLGDYTFYLSHYPTICSTLTDGSSLKNRLLNLHGHIHTNKKFIYDAPFIYNVAADAQRCTPVSLDRIICDMKDEVEKCYALLRD